MRSHGWLLALLLSLLLPAPALAGHYLPEPFKLRRVNRHLCGQVVDYTCHHGADNRIYSEALGEKRDMYVYLPPSFDPCKQYPILIWLHGFMQDEESFIDHLIVPLDQAIACGKLPPMIIAAPDGTIKGYVKICTGNSFFLNTKAGRFEDYLIQDVWNFLTSQYPIRPEREAHVLAGASMGGFAAYNLSFKYPHRFKVAIGIFPPLNLRWVDCHCRYLANFDPCCWGWRTSVKNGHEPIARFLGGLFTVRLKKLIDPLFDRSSATIARLSYENPIEMLDRLDIHDGDFDMFIAYAGKDQFNIDAQVESFLYVARQRCITVATAHDPRGRHNVRTAQRFFDDIIQWLGPRLAPYAPQ